VDHYETHRRHKDGRILDISLTVSPIRDSEGTIIGASKVARDITDRKLTEKALIEQSERLARSNADLQEFAYVVSHDLQEPLRTVASLSQLLQRRYRSRLDGDADQLIGMIVSSSERMSALIRDVLSYTRVTGGAAPRPSEVNPNTLVEWVTENLHASIEETRTRIETAELPVVIADKASLAHVFQNLIGNAIKYRGPDPPVIRISAEARNSEWVFSVADNGIGIAPAYHQSVFGLFRRLHGNEYPGTGIGLALCKQLIEKQGGRIWVESEAGHGATFRFTIPRVENNAA